MSRNYYALILALVVLANSAQAQTFERPTPKTGFSYPDYYCTNRGVRVDVENFDCLTVGGKSFEAKCDLSLNSPMWRATGKECEPAATSEIRAVLPN